MRCSSAVMTSSLGLRPFRKLLGCDRSIGWTSGARALASAFADAASCPNAISLATIKLLKFATSPLGDPRLYASLSVVGMNTVAIAGNPNRSSCCRVLFIKTLIAMSRGA